LDGPVNAVAPIPCTNVDFFSKLSEKLKSNITLKIPSYIPRFISKEITDEILISDQFVRPAKLIANKYSFFTPNLNEALDNAFGF
jgi:NAD dependent epimerase/dehydratase family enzyme